MVDDTAPRESADEDREGEIAETPADSEDIVGADASGDESERAESDAYAPEWGVPEAVQHEDTLDGGADVEPDVEIADEEMPEASTADVAMAEPDAETVYWSESPLGFREAEAGHDDVHDAESSQGDAETSDEQSDQPSGEAEATHPLGQPAEIDMGPQRRSRWWVWLLVGLAVAVAAGGATYAWWWMTARDIVVPDLVGQQAAEATQALNDVALTLGDVSEVPTDVAPVGTIISQNPEAGSRLKPNDAVSFVLAAAPEQAKVPNVVGLSLEDAAVLLAKARLRPAEVRSHNATAATDFVIAQVPGHGVELMPGSPVALMVSKGPAPGDTTVPAVTGLSEGDAVALIGAKGLTARVYRSLDPSIGAGVVVTQTPLPGTALAPSSSVQVLVSKGFGSGSISVPDVVNDTRKDAVQAVRAAGLKAVVVFQFHPTIARGTVISQMPLAGRRVQSGDNVGLLVSRGPVTTALVPSIVGSSSAEATAAVSNAGFKPVIVEVEMPGRTAGVVVGQFPPPSTSYELRYPVICLIAEEIEP